MKKKYNSKTKWLNTSFANSYRKAIRGNSAVHSVYIAQVAAGAAAHIQTIIMSDHGGEALRATAVAKAHIAGINTIKEIQDKRKQRENEIKQQWGVK
jgi:hypothetical protein